MTRGGACSLLVKGMSQVIQGITIIRTLAAVYGYNLPYPLDVCSILR
jgi:hypothetical protein